MCFVFSIGIQITLKQTNTVETSRSIEKEFEIDIRSMGNNRQYKRARNEIDRHAISVDHLSIINKQTEDSPVKAFVHKTEE